MAAGDARRVAEALGAERAGAGWLAPCPAHDDRRPSLSIRESAGGLLLVHCFAGCDARAVLRALAGRGLIDRRAAAGEIGQLSPAHQAARRREEQRDEERRRSRAVWQWRKAQAAEGSPVATYLREARGIPLCRIPEALRFEPHAFAIGETRSRPAMIALVTDGRGRPCGIHRTFLRPFGRGKAELAQPRMMFGPVAGGAVRLAPPAPRLAVAEGVETALAFMVATDVPTWSALSAPNLARLALPAAPAAAELVIAADNDPAGIAAAEVLAERAEREGRRVRIAEPPPGLDFCDVLNGAAAPDPDRTA